MAFDEGLDARIMGETADWGLTRKKMFGGACYLLDGNMVAGVHKDMLVLRLGPEAGDEALADSHVRPFDITGRPMKGWVMVDSEGAVGDALADWLAKAREFVKTLPPK